MIPSGPFLAHPNHRMVALMDTLSWCREQANYTEPGHFHAAHAGKDFEARRILAAVDAGQNTRVAATLLWRRAIIPPKEEGAAFTTRPVAVGMTLYHLMPHLYTPPGVTPDRRLPSVYDKRQRADLKERLHALSSEALATGSRVFLVSPTAAHPAHEALLELAKDLFSVAVVAARRGKPTGARKGKESFTVQAYTRKEWEKRDPAHVGLLVRE